MTTPRRAAALAAAAAAVVVLGTLGLTPTAASAHGGGLRAPVAVTAAGRPGPAAHVVIEQGHDVATLDASSSTTPAPANPSGARGDQRNVQLLAGVAAAVFVLAGGLVMSRAMRRQDR